MYLDVVEIQRRNIDSSTSGNSSSSSQSDSEDTSGNDAGALRGSLGGSIGCSLGTGWRSEVVSPCSRGVTFLRLLTWSFVFVGFDFLFGSDLEPSD